jgi:hypothetical protein
VLKMGLTDERVAKAPSPRWWLRAERKTGIRRPNPGCGPAPCFLIEPGFFGAEIY